MRMCHIAQKPKTKEGPVIVYTQHRERLSDLEAVCEVR
jgi:hypothetical protein